MRAARRLARCQYSVTATGASHIKMIKRQMFSHAGLPLLRKRVLLTARSQPAARKIPCGRQAIAASSGEHGDSLRCCPGSSALQPQSRRPAQMSMKPS
jgi:hypothetical protein